MEGKTSEESERSSSFSPCHRGREEHGEVLSSFSQCRKMLESLLSPGLSPRVTQWAEEDGSCALRSGGCSVVCIVCCPLLSLSLRFCVPIKLLVVLTHPHSSSSSRRRSIIARASNKEDAAAAPGVGVGAAAASSSSSSF